MNCFLCSKEMPWDINWMFRQYRLCPDCTRSHDAIRELNAKFEPLMVRPLEDDCSKRLAEAKGRLFVAKAVTAAVVLLSPVLLGWWSVAFIAASILVTRSLREEHNTLALSNEKRRVQLLDNQVRAKRLIGKMVSEWSKDDDERCRAEEAKSTGLHHLPGAPDWGALLQEFPGAERILKPHDLLRPQD